MPTTDELQAQVDQLKQQQAITAEAIRRILEGRWNGPLPNADAHYVALVGGTPPADFKPVPFG